MQGVAIAAKAKDRHCAASGESSTSSCSLHTPYNYCAGMGRRHNMIHHRASGGTKKRLIGANDAVKIGRGGVDHVDNCAGACGPIINATPVCVAVCCCCMCGDAGIAELLFVCSKCSHRHQHIYCSRSYPNMGEEACICNWCLHEADSMNSSAHLTKASDSVVINKTEPESANSALGIKRVPHTPAVSNVYGDVKFDRQLVRSRVLENGKTVTKKSTPSKAFECLLLVAAQSLHGNKLISGTNVDIKQCDNHDTSLAATSESGGSPAKLGKVDNGASEMMKVINATPLVKKVNVHPHYVEDKSSNMEDCNKLSMSLGSHENMGIHNQVEISIHKYKNVDVGGLIGSSIPRRQRCSIMKGNNIAALKCRKKGLQLNIGPSRPNYRMRYKLLADVVC